MISEPNPTRNIVPITQGMIDRGYEALSRVPFIENSPNCLTVDQIDSAVLSVLRAALSKDGFDQPVSLVGQIGELHGELRDLDGAVLEKGGASVITLPLEFVGGNVVGAEHVTVFAKIENYSMRYVVTATLKSFDQLQQCIRSLQQGGVIDCSGGGSA